MKRRDALAWLGGGVREALGREPRFHRFRDEAGAEGSVSLEEMASLRLPQRDAL